MTPLYGGFPVKLTTHLGDPFDTSDMEVEEIRTETISRVQKLIQKHQKLPGNVYQAVMARFEANDEESEDEDFIDCNEAIEKFSSSMESLINNQDCEEISDSGCVSIASSTETEEEEDETGNGFLLQHKNSITKLPNGRLVLLGAL